MNDVFVTGATGAIGSAVVPRLLRQTDARIWLLMRAPSPALARARLADMLAHWGLQDGADAAQRLCLLHGDIVLPGFGLDASTLDTLARECSRIIHCAASVKLNMPLEQALSTAVLPTRSVMALARRGAELGRLKKVDLVSTVGVWGRTPGCMPERPLPEVGSFHNTYEAAKAEAERLVWAEGGDLPITVHRPSMVVGETGTGQVIHFQVFYHLCEFLSGARTFGIMPGLGQTRLDTVPVDWVADAICWSSQRTQTAGQILHLCAGPQQAMRLLDLQQAVRLAWRDAGRKLPSLRTVDRRWLERLVPAISLLAGARNRRALRGLAPVLAYLGESQSFDNRHSAAQLAAHGLQVPDPQGYLPRVLDFYLRHRPDRRPE